MEYMDTYKYHKPVNWHISGDSAPVNEFARNPLLSRNPTKGIRNMEDSLANTIKFIQKDSAHDIKITQAH
jgi:hypothetical protein